MQTTGANADYTTRTLAMQSAFVFQNCNYCNDGNINADYRTKSRLHDTDAYLKCIGSKFILN